jgi:hypothetical protein
MHTHTIVDDLFVFLIYEGEHGDEYRMIWVTDEIVLSPMKIIPIPLIKDNILHVHLIYTYFYIYFSMIL